MNDDTMNQYLEPTSTIESDHPSVIQFTQQRISGGDDISQAISLYYAVRDNIRYDPYSGTMDVAGLKASTTLSTGRGWCVPKAILLAACCRQAGIPARLGFADVRNHMSTARLRKIMGTDIFYWHGYTDIFLFNKWVKSTPAFNIELCDKFRLKPLEFDGREDSIYHPFDLEGNHHMEYLHYRGEYADMPIDEMNSTFARRYGFVEMEGQAGDFDREVEQETHSI